MTDKQALRKAAIAATGGKWVFSRSGANSNVQAPIELQKGGRALVVLCKLNNAGWSGQIQTENNAKFIAAANPETVLALLDELEVRDKQVAELVTGRLNLQWILNVYAHAYEEAKEQIAKDVEIKARLCRESNSLFDRLRATEKRIAELEAKLQTADKLQDSAFRHGLQHGFSYGQTNDQAGFEQCLAAYSSRGKDNG